MYQHGAVFMPDKVVKGQVVAVAPEPNKIVGALMGFPVVDADGQCSPRHTISSNSGNEGLI